MSEAKVNRRWVLKQYPKGVPTDEDVVMVSEPVPEPGDGQVLVKNHYISVDPYQRGRMTGRKTYAAPDALGDSITAGGVGTVIKSNSPDIPVGTLVSGIFRWQEYAVADAKQVYKVPENIPKLSYSQGVLGMPGATAYFGFLRIIEPEKGKTLFVTGAAGAVGSVVGQIGKIEGLKVIGSAGSQEKLDYLKEIGFDEVINYKGKDTSALQEELKALAPEGIDYFFDNTGGPMSDAVFLSMNTFGKVSVCGQIHGYNKVSVASVPVRMISLRKQLRVEGFIVRRWLKEWPEAFAYLGKHIVEGNIKARETITEGFENVFKAFLGLFTGENIGKQVVHISDPE